MKNIKNILVTLDLSDIDDTVIKNASYFAEEFAAENVYFIHNIKKYEIETLFEDELADLNLEEVIGEELNEKVSSLFTADIPHEVLISDDPSTESLIEYIVHKYAIDLTIVGNKTNIKGSGVLGNKLLRMLKCHILSIPEHHQPKIEKVWVGTDFSNHSRKIFELLNTFRKREDYQLKVAHAYGIPMHFSPHIREDKMVAEVSTHLNKKAKKYLESVKVPVSSFQLFRRKDLTVAEVLIQNARKENADLIVVGDRGSNNFSSLLVGTVAEEIFSSVERIAVLIVK